WGLLQAVAVMAALVLPAAAQCLGQQFLPSRAAGVQRLPAVKAEWSQDPAVQPASYYDTAQSAPGCEQAPPSPPPSPGCDQGAPPPPPPAGCQQGAPNATPSPSLPQCCCECCPDCCCAPCKCPEKAAPCLPCPRINLINPSWNLLIGGWLE